MVSDPFVIAAICMGLLSALVVTGVALSVGAPRVNEALPAFLSGAGVVSGVKVCTIALGAAIAVSTSDRTYIFLGGVAVVLLSLEALAARIGGLRKRQ